MKQAPQPAPGPAADDTASQTGALLAELRGGSGAEATPPRPSRRVSSQSILTLGILVVGGGMLFAMRSYGMRSGMTFQTVLIDFDHTSIRSARTPDEERILAALDCTRQTPQVPVESIDKNPFLLTVPADLSGMPEVDPGLSLAEKLAEVARQRKEARENELRKALATLELQSVVTGTRPVAKIGGKVHVVGDVVADHFKITAIGGRSVDLEADGRAFTLEIGAAPVER